MSLARAFTTRRAKVFGGDGEPKVARSNTVRTKISGPVELVHTTNMLSYNAPDIRPGPKISAPTQLIHTTNMLSYDAPDIQKEPKTATSNSSLSLRSEADSERSQTAASSPPTSPDTAFPHGGERDGDESPSAPAPNHLSCYFTLPGQPAPTNAPPVPSIPKRAPSHTKRSYEPVSPKMSISHKPSISERLGSKPSVSRLSEQSERSASSKTSGSFSRTSSASSNTTASHHSVGSYQQPKTTSKAPSVPVALSTSATPSQHREPGSAKEPFGHELAKVTELAEEYASKAAEKSRMMATQEERDLAARGLEKFSPEEYISEIQSLFMTFFAEARHAKNVAPQWI